MRMRSTGSSPIVCCYFLQLLTYSAHRLVSDEGRAFSAQMTERGRSKDSRLAHPVLGKAPPHVSFTFCIISADGTLHTPHIDANGFFTMLHVISGCKLIVFGSPSTTKPSTLAHLKDSWEFLRDPTLIRGAVLLKPGDILCVNLFH
jgi:hypothetical protein